MARTTTYHFTQEQYIALATQCQDDLTAAFNALLEQPDARHKAARLLDRTGFDHVNDALARHATWAIDADKYAHCDIYLQLDSQPEVRAVYRPAPDEPVAYVIGAVWHGTHFGFHS